MKSGDTLSGIAKKYGTTVPAIQKLNLALIKNVNFILTGWKSRVKKLNIPAVMPASVLRNARRLFIFSSAQIGSESPVETGGGYVMTEEIANVQSGYFTQDRIQSDLDYRRAQDIAKNMLDDGLISVAESTN